MFDISLDCVFLETIINANSLCIIVRPELVYMDPSIFHKLILFFSAFGFHLEESLFNFNQKCIENNDPNTNIHKPPAYCPPGTFYPYSRGYQKIPGDTCQYGEDYRYDPLLYSCPVAGKSRLKSVDRPTPSCPVAGKSRLKSVDRLTPSCTHVQWPVSLD
jgi:hypothetical protein